MILSQKLLVNKIMQRLFETPLHTAEYWLQNKTFQVLDTANSKQDVC